MEFINTLVAEAKSISSNPGAAATFGLTGNEYKLWIKKNLCTKVWAEVYQKYGSNANINLQDYDGKLLFIDAVRKNLNNPMTPEQKEHTDNVETVSFWLTGLGSYLLHGRKWEQEEYNRFQQLQEDICNRWESVTGRTPTNKVHILKHCVEYTRKWQYLGRDSESRVESEHSTFNKGIDHTHCNVAQYPAENLHRSHVSTIQKTIRNNA